MSPCGFPHSEICGSKLICSSPQLIAAYHVFHRLPVPRHSPCALIRLTVLYPLILHLPTKKFSVFEIAVSNYIYFLSFAVTIQFSRCNLEVFLFSQEVVGSSGLEPPTSRLSGARSNHLSYEPILVEIRRLELLTPCLQSRCSPS